MKKVALYIRVSTQEQANEGYSIAGQKEKLINYCKLRDWIIQDIYIDGGFSGTNLDRPALQKLLNNLDNIDIVLVYKLDRLSRNQRNLLYLVEEKFGENNIDFVSILENFDTTTPFGRAMMGILAVFAQLERDTIVERTKMGKERRAQEGYWNGGPPPFGYDLIDEKLIINAYEAMIVKEIFELYKKYGQNTISRILNSKGYKTKKGKWHGKAVKRILDNYTYCGLIQYDGNIYEGVHDAIISKEEFEAVQKIMKCRKNNKIRKSKHLLGGMVWCGFCGARLKPAWSGTGKTKYYHYVCYSVSKRPVHMIKDPDCPGHYWKMERLDKKVVDEIKKIKLDKEKFIEKHKRRKPQTNSQVNLDIIENKIKSLDAQIDKLMDLYSLDHMPVEKISQKIEALYNEKKKLQENFETMKSEVAATKETVSIETILKYVDNFEVIWSEATFEEKREILQGFIKKIIVTEKVEIVWNI
ncbi:MAG: site-specific recombinase [Candidatus Petromonas sp.]|jgi:site-specific DNA recombinase|nr:site-specific recombinase [Candidatus Petromonas sp.]